MQLDDEALELLRQQVKADEDKNRLKQAELNVLRRREQLSLDEREATVKLRAEVERLVLELRELSEEIAANTSSNVLSANLLAKRVDRLSNEVERLSEEVSDIEQGLYSVLSRDLANMRRSKDRMGERIETREELKIHYHNLRKLREQAAQHGMDVPLNISNAIELEERKIQELEE